MLRRRLSVLVAVVVAVGAVTAAFKRDVFTSSGPEIRAIFASGAQLRPGSAVRVAGLDVGRVSEVQASTDGRAMVTMQLRSGAPTLRVDARLTIRARLAFEGNFYVDVNPGTASAARLRDGDVIPERRTAIPVQIDQVQNTLTQDVRDGLVGTMRELGGGFGSAGGGAAGFDGLARATRELDRALRPLARTARAMRGLRPGQDLPRAIDATGRFAATFARDPAALTGAVVAYERVVRTFARGSGDLRRSIVAAERFVDGAPAALRRIDRTLPDVASFARAARPAVRALPATARSATAALRQIEAISRSGEGPTLVGALAEPLRILPEAQRGLTHLAGLVTPIGQCISETVVPALDQKLQDGPLTTGDPVWLEALHAASNLATGSQGFDANGTTFRVGLGQGEQLVTGLIPGGAELSSMVSGGMTGVSPVPLPPGRWPQKRPDLPCREQRVPNLHSQSTDPFSTMRSRRVAGTRSAEESRRERREGLAGLERQLDDLLAAPARKDR
ncbi:MAG: MlaD family protein [Solirubrobacteraceae bacterium]